VLTVGGTSGIGETTAREFVRYTPSPKVYLVGRSQADADRIIAEFKQINSKSQVEFIKSDVSLLRNVDKVCDEIKAREKKINLLVLSCGILTTAGRTGMSTFPTRRSETKIMH
jgi:short-subunit dehydrogenase